MYIVNSALALIIGGTSHAQVNSSDTLTPLRVVEKYVSGEQWNDKFKYFCCEMQAEWKTDSTLGQILPKRIHRDCQLIFMDTAHATVDAWLHDSATSKDYYFFLVKQRVWTVYAIRTLLNTEFIEQDLLSLDSVPRRKRKKYKAESGYSWQFEYDNLSLWTSPDSFLVTNFRRNEIEFTELQTDLRDRFGYGTNDSLVNGAKSDKKVKCSMQELLLRDITVTKKYPGCVFYMIGGIKDNAVGYMYQPDPSKVPLMTEKHFILVRPLGNGWYLFKTT